MLSLMLGILSWHRWIEVKKLNHPTTDHSLCSNQDLIFAWCWIETCYLHKLSQLWLKNDEPTNSSYVIKKGTVCSRWVLVDSTLGILASGF